MEKTLELTIRVEKDGTFGIESYETESGEHYTLGEFNVKDPQSASEAEKKIAGEVLSWVGLWHDLMSDGGDD